MAYTTDKKSTGLELLTDLTITQSDLHIVGDVSDSGRAKAITENELEDYIANSTNFIDELVANNYFTTELANDTNFVNELTNNTLFQTNVNSFVTVPASSSGGGGNSSGKPISFSSTWTGSAHQQGYVDQEAILYSNNGSQISFQSPINGIQYRNTTSDWASSAGVQGYVLMGDYLYLLLAKGGSPLEQRLYRYDASDLSLGGTLMTISGQAFGIAGSFQMTSDGVYFYFSSDAGTTANDYEIAKYSLSGTTLTYVSTTTCGSTPTQFASFTVDSSGQYIGYDTQVLYVFDNTGTLTDTIPLTGGSASTSFLNWTNTIYFKNANQDFVKLDLLGTDISGSGNTIVGIANEDLTAGTPVGISPIIGGVAKAVKGFYTQTITPSSALEERTIKIATDKVVTVYAQSGTITTLKVFAATVNTASFTNSFTVGTEQTVTTTLNTSGSSSIYDIGKLDDNKFFITYTESGAPTVLRLVIGTISGTTITLGTPVNAYTFGSSITNTNALGISTDKGLMIVSGNSGNAYGIAFTSSGTVATIGTPLDLGGTSTGASVSCLIGTDKVALSIYGNIRIITLSGTSLTVGSLSSYDGTATNDTAYHDIVSHQNDGFIVRNQKAAGSGYEVIAGTVSGTTITLGTIVDTLTGGGLYVISPTQFLLQGTISSSPVFLVYNISGSTIDTNYTISNGISTTRRGIIDMGTYFLALELNATTLTYYFGGMSPGFIGFVQSTVSKGSTVVVLISGTDSNQTGLIAGSYYLVSEGALTTINLNRNITSINDTAVVKALSTTEVLF